MMDKAILNKVKQNVAKEIGASSYEEVIRADEKKIKEFAILAQKKARIKTNVKANTISSGNPYVMLSRKVNNKGKRI